MGEGSDDHHELAGYEDESSGDQSQSVNISAFGHEFTDFPSGLAEHLVTLEREGSVYSHFADMETVQPDGTAQFRYFRIKFQPREIFEYVEAALAYQQFNREADRLETGGQVCHERRVA